MTREKARNITLVVIILLWLLNWAVVGNPPKHHPRIGEDAFGVTEDDRQRVRQDWNA